MIAAVAAVALAGAVTGTVIRLRTVPTRAGCAGIRQAEDANAELKAADLSFTMKDMSGQDVTLSQYKGKVILLNFWATWCGPCRVEIPEFIDFQSKYGEAGLQVVGVSIDDTFDKLDPYVKDMKINYPVLQGLGHDDVQIAFGPMVAIPVTAVISREGMVCATHFGLTGKGTLEREIETLLEVVPERDLFWFL